MLDRYVSPVCNRGQRRVFEDWLIRIVVPIPYHFRYRIEIGRTPVVSCQVERVMNRITFTNGILSSWIDIVFVIIESTCRNAHIDNGFPTMLVSADLPRSVLKPMV